MTFTTKFVDPWTGNTVVRTSEPKMRAVPDLVARGFHIDAHGRMGYTPSHSDQQAANQHRGKPVHAAPVKRIDDFMSDAAKTPEPFVVGDRVRVTTKCACFSEHGKEGTVTSVQGRSAVVQLDGMYAKYGYEFTSIERIAKKPLTLDDWKKLIGQRVRVTQMTTNVEMRGREGVLVSVEPSASNGYVLTVRHDNDIFSARPWLLTSIEPI